MEFSTLGELSVNGKGSYGIAASAVPYSKDLYTYLRITDITDDGRINFNGLTSVDDVNAEKYKLKPNDIVFARTGGSTGRNYFYDGHDGEFVYAGFLIKFSIDSQKVNPKFIKYYCQSKEYKDWVRSFNTGSTRGNINAQTYAAMPIPMLSRKQQDGIVSILEAIDKKIEENNHINENLEQQATAIFSNLAENSPSKKPLSDFIRIKHGYAFKGDYISTEDNGIVLVTPGNFCIGGGFKESKCKYFIAEYPEDYVLQPDSLIVTMTDLSKEADTLGFGALVPRSSERVYLHNQRIGLVEPLNDELPISFLYWYMRSYEYHMKIVGSASGSTVKHTSPGRILEQLIPIPKKEDLLKYGAVLDAIDNIVSRNNAENIYLQSLREVLLPKLMSGEITVDDAVF